MIEKEEIMKNIEGKGWEGVDRKIQSGVIKKGRKIIKGKIVKVIIKVDISRIGIGKRIKLGFR